MLLEAVPVATPVPEVSLELTEVISPPVPFEPPVPAAEFDAIEVAVVTVSPTDVELPVVVVPLAAELICGGSPPPV